MHNKSFTVDNQATILGGRNIGNEYFDADPDLAFADLDVIGVGPVAGRLRLLSTFTGTVSWPIRPASCWENRRHRRKFHTNFSNYSSLLPIKRIRNT